MADRPREDDWWQASDGKWYPPDLIDAPRQHFDTTEIQPVVPGEGPRRVSPGVFVQMALVAAALTNAAMAWTGLGFARELRSSDVPLFIDGIPTYPIEADAWLSASAFQLLATLVAAVAVIVWLFKVSKTLGERGVGDRSWSPGWAIGGWFIPFANLVIPKLVVGEIERIAQVPYDGEPVGTRWKSKQRSSVGDLWWFLWVGGNLVAVAANLMQTAEAENDQIATFITIESFGAALSVGAALALIAVIRNIVRSAND